MYLARYDASNPRLSALWRDLANQPHVLASLVDILLGCVGTWGSRAGGWSFGVVYVVLCTGIERCM
jgi:hypothetical protein